MGLSHLVVTADELALRESEEAKLLAEAEEKTKQEEEQKVSNLVAHIKTAWEKATRAKQTVANEMMASLRQRNGEYDPQKLADIRKIRSSEVYMMLTNTKCRSAEAWIRDILFQPGQKPWDIEPTPKPEIPEDMEQGIRQKFYQEAFLQLIMGAAETGQPLDVTTLMEQVKGMEDEFEKRLQALIFDKAMEQAKEVAKEIEDVFIEGGLYEALDQCIWDIVTLKAAFIKGPIPRMEKISIPNRNPMTGMYEVMEEERIIDTYDCVSPFDIFPAPDTTGINDGDLIEREYFTPSQLDELIGVPGYREEDIIAILKEHSEGKLNDWVTDIDQARVEQEQQRKDETNMVDLSKIPCLEWWGSALGSKFLELGLTSDRVDKPINPDRIYHGTAWMIGNHIIKAILNPDPNGFKPYDKASYEQFPRAFWGRSIPEILKDIASILNACARAIVNNIAIASGPQVEANKDRFPAGYDFTMWGWKVWLSDESNMGSDKPALQFYQPPMVVDKLMNVYTTFTKVSDDYTVPAYAHGDPSVGGAGNTASGLSMLLGGSARGIKDVIKHIDMYLIGPIVRRQFFLNLRRHPRKGVIGDLKVVAKGSSYLSVRQEQAMRLMEFARNTVNPIDYQLQGPDGRKYVLKSAAQAMNIDPEKAFPEPISGQIAPMQSMMLPPGNNQPSPANLDAAGNPVKGTDTRMFNEGR